MRKILHFLFLTLCVFLIENSTFAQNNAVFGTVLNAKTGEPLHLANVFFDQTTIGTQTDKNGYFRITDVPDGTYTLVFSYLGFHNSKVVLSFPRESLRPLKVLMTPKTIEMKNLIVYGEYPKAWNEDYQKFKEYFLGVSRNAEKIEILNPYALRFKDKEGVLIAMAEKPLEIINKALGYQITYYLEKFTVNYPSLRTSAALKFTQLKAKSVTQLKSWKEERAQAYNGSFRHFVDALVAGQLQEEGFITGYTKKRFGEEDGVTVKNTATLWSYKSPHKIILSFKKDYPFLRVMYTGEHPKEEIALFAYQDPDGYQISYIKLPEGKAIIDLQSGAQMKPYFTVLFGYWAWTNRLPDLLPKNYEAD